MNCLTRLLLLALLVSCASKKRDAYVEESTPPTSAEIIVDDSNAVADSGPTEGVTIEATFAGQFSISGIPEGRFFKSQIELVISDPKDIKGIEYSIGPSCTESVAFDPHTDMNKPLEIDLKDFHGKIQLCIKAIDANNISSEKFEIFEWDQGYPEIVNKAVHSRCRTTQDSIRSSRYRLEVKKENPLAELDVFIVGQNFIGPRCPSSNEPRENRLEASSLLFENGTVSFIAGGIFYSFEINFEETEARLIHLSGIEDEAGREWSIVEL
ncbi:MAG: hypothetical protein HRU19_01385 [Pseudobacteriovorax sp.]|nr:hypothetical protein [Pseudobacteriovorax sp.]